MLYTNYWMLPDGIQEELPHEAEQMESLRRDIIDLYRCWGYRLVITPLAEYMDSLRTGSGTLLDLQTVKITDQLSGRQLGIRADITPQVARIDAHRLKTDGINRLCYYGRVLRAKSMSLGGSRSPLQIGAELFGHQGLDSDCEVINLMLHTLQTCRVDNIVLDLGHVQIFRGLAKQANFSESEEKAFFDKLQRKSMPEIQAWVAEKSQEKSLSDDVAQMLLALPTLSGEADILTQAEQCFATANEAVKQALAELNALVQRLLQSTQNMAIQIRLHIDLSELRGYTYHTGVVYAAYKVGEGRELARGGRYDNIGEHFGNARPATGFSASLCHLFAMGDYQSGHDRTPIIAPENKDNDAALEAMIQQLREQGETVIRHLAGQVDHSMPQGQRYLVQQQGQWLVQAQL
ncbi:MAG TPA: ATP phosphoribosyltransferase regulatory subunit [Thiothrix sp.]|nr:ATP phosphoribosyltransferase regulatory subunit [Thiothrix sp.]